jgi:uncharacterized repeat protein (TIGR01451 family)
MWTAQKRSADARHSPTFLGGEGSVASFFRAEIFSRLAALYTALTALLIGSFFAYTAEVHAAPPAPGTVIQNVATSTQVDGATGTSTSNAVTLVIGAPAPLPGAPTLAKAFAVATIDNGQTTSLIFTLTNAAGNPSQTGIGFTDTLPSGLALALGATATISGVGCTGNTSINPVGAISVSNLSMALGTASCTVTVAGITNAPLQFNADCSSSPAAFTNGAANVSALTNINNVSAGACLVVRGVAVSATPQCVKDAPYVNYSLTPVGLPAGPATIVWEKLDGTVVATLTNQALTGTLLWPAAAVDAGGNGIAWPGWQFTAGQWVQINDGLRPQMRLRITINPTTLVTVSYPPATPTCNANPPAPPVVDPDTLPTLTKSFESSTIIEGASTALVFRVSPALKPAGLSGGLAFTDILPDGLVFKPGADIRFEGGCSGGVTSFTSYRPPQPNILAVQSIFLVDPTKICTIRVDGVTNAPGRTNSTGCQGSNEADFTNGPNRIDQVKNLNNSVLPQCLRVLDARPNLSKRFLDERIYEGDSTTLNFEISNSSTRPEVSGVSFTDSLPSGLRILPSGSATIVGIGCTGNVLIAASTIAVSGLRLAAGTSQCVVRVTGVSNVPQQRNASCQGLPSAFTNTAQSISALTNLHNFVAPACLVVDAKPSALDLNVAKALSATEGFSPSGAYLVTLSIPNNGTGADARKRDVTISDVLPAGMSFVPGSLRVTVGSRSFVASGAEGTDPFGGRNLAYVTATDRVSVSFGTLEGGDSVSVVFAVLIGANIQRETTLTNIARVAFTNSAGRTLTRDSNAVAFRVLGSLGVRVTGQTINAAVPGQELLFRNVITNLGDVVDTYDITLTGANFPSGTSVQLLNADGTQPLADASGNGVPDSGAINPGASAVVVVRVRLPQAIPPGGPYSVIKTARSTRSTAIVASDADVLTLVNQDCRVVLEPDNAGRLRPGASLTYFHLLTNVGNCEETITAGNLSSGPTGWTASAFLNIDSVPSGAIAGVPGSGNPPASQTVTLRPGQSVSYLVNVTSPASASSGATATHVLSFTATPNGSASAARTVRNTDVTTVDPSGPNQPGDIIRPFVDGEYRRPTVWAFIGQTLYLRAEAPSCNAQPDVIERRTILITGPNGEREELIAIETGPNTGIFDISLPVRAPPVVAGNGALEGRPYDTFLAEIVGCGRRIATSVTLIDPFGVVFDSRTNEPVSGATVRLVTANGGVCSNAAADVLVLDNGRLRPAPNPVVTGANGRFEFPLVSAGEYCLRVQTPNGYTWTSTVAADQLPRGRNILATGPTSGGSYGGSFRVTNDAAVLVDIPVDAGRIDGLFIRKETLRQVVELGEFTDYTVTVTNQSGVALGGAGVVVTDDLPAGFSYIPGTARLDGTRIADPKGGSGPRLVFNIGNLKVAQQAKLQYRVRVGPGALEGDGINRAVATYQPSIGGQFSASNTATAKVIVNPGVFTDKAFIVGKVYADCNRDGVQGTTRKRDGSDAQLTEVGIPAVRLYLEDGTNVVTDAEGKFSIYGILPRTHILKIDRTTLPEGVTVQDLALLSNRQLGKGDSRILDLKNGEMHKANFAVSTCAPATLAGIEARRSAATSINAEVEGRLQQRLTTEVTRPLNDVKALPASGTIGQVVATATGAGSVSPGNSASRTVGVDDAALGRISTPQERSRISELAAEAPRHHRESSATAEQALELILPQLDNKISFVGLSDGDVLPYAQTPIRVKGAAGTQFILKVNGEIVTETRVGKRAVLQEKQLQAWEYIGVNLKSGTNELSVEQIDQFGNSRGSSSLRVKAPGELARIDVSFSERIQRQGGGVADGRTPVVVQLKLVDKDGTPVTARLPVTLSADLVRWDVTDMNPAEPGTQVFVEGGGAEFKLLPPNEPIRATLKFVSGRAQTEMKFDFLPDLRELIAAGVIEGALNLRKLDSRALQPAREQDAFEREIRHLSTRWNDGKGDHAIRAAMFLKGKIKGEYLITLAYDSDKDTRERLFRDIQPDEYYPVYGDSSVRAFDAQSTGRFYVRVDHRKSYLLYGDFNTAVAADNRQLSNYNRSLTGVKQHYENAGISANVFASRDTTRQVIDEFRANGTSGPFTLTVARGLINSEKLEVLTRDRNQPAIVLRAVQLSRFVDYEIEPLTGRILLKAPLASLDENLNPISLRVTYEVDQGGNEFWVAGADAQLKIGKNLEVGAAVVEDRNPLDRFRMLGLNAVAKLADKTFLIAEIAQTNRDKSAQGAAVVGAAASKGVAKRVELKHSSADAEANLYVAHSEIGFDNPTASLSKGRAEAGGKLSYRLNEITRVRGELLVTEDLQSKAKRDGVLLAIERNLSKSIRFEAGVRHARDTQAPALPGNSGTSGQAVKQEVTTVRARLTGEVPGVKGATMYGEAEVDVQDADRRILALGGDYALPNKGRIYARHEFMSSITGPYGLNNQQRQNATVIGLTTDYMKDGNLFSEYRVRDAISGGDAEAALGLRNTWTLREGVKLQTGFERVHALAGTGNAESTALTGGLEYLASERWKASTRLELRDGKTQDSLLSTIAIASKLNRDWTLLGRNTYSLAKNKGASTGENEQERMQVGLAYRDTDTDLWNALGRIEYRTESDTTQKDFTLKRTVEMFSLHANWQPRKPFTFSARYAAKRANEQSNGLSTKNTAHLIIARALWDIAPRWDVGVNASTMLGNGARSKQYGLGVELGFMVMENLWLSAGYNWFGYRDKDLTGSDYTNKGAYLRLRYKFDEDLFVSKKTASATAAAEATR